MSDETQPRPIQYGKCKACGGFVCTQGEPRSDRCIERFCIHCGRPYARFTIRASRDCCQCALALPKEEDE